MGLAEVKGPSDLLLHDLEWQEAGVAKQSLCRSFQENPQAPIWAVGGAKLPGSGDVRIVGALKRCPTGHF